MSNNADWFPSDEATQVLVLTNAKDKISNYSTQFGLTPLQVAKFVDNCNAFIDIINKVNEIRETGKAYTPWKNTMLHGTKGLPAPAAPVFQSIVFPASITTGIEEQIRDFVANVKTLDGYTKQAGEDLDFEVTKSTDGNIADAFPTLHVAAIGGFAVEVSYKKGEFDGIILEYRAAGSNDWKFADKVSITKFNFTPQLSAAGQAQEFEFRAKYIIKNQQVGQWSQLAVITVIA